MYSQNTENTNRRPYFITQKQRKQKSESTLISRGRYKLISNAQSFNETPGKLEIAREDLIHQYWTKNDKESHASLQPNSRCPDVDHNYFGTPEVPQQHRQQLPQPICSAHYFV